MSEVLQDAILHRRQLNLAARARDRVADGIDLQIRDAQDCLVVSLTSANDCFAPRDELSQIEGFVK